MIYTSYFAKVPELTRHLVLPISIAAKAPAGFTGLEYKALAPSYSILMSFKRDQNEALYTKQYTEKILNRLDPDLVIRDLQTMAAESQDIALICYERPESFCHRHLVANWLSEHGITCKEWQL